MFLVTAVVAVAPATPLGGAVERGIVEVSKRNYAESIDMLFDVRSGGSLSLGTSIGSVVVETWPREQVRLVVTKRTHADGMDAARKILESFNVRARHGGRDLELEGRSSTPDDAVDVEFTLWVPKSYNLDIRTRRGTITLPEVDGTFSARTDKGRIVLDCSTDDLDIEVEDRSGESASAAGEPRHEGAGPGSSYGAR